MSKARNKFLSEHRRLTRRYFLEVAGASTAAISLWPDRLKANDDSAALAKAIAELEPYFTPAAEFRDVSRGTPLPHSLPDEKKREVGLTRETWRLEVNADPGHPTKLGRP